MNLKENNFKENLENSFNFLLKLAENTIKDGEKFKMAISVDGKPQTFEIGPTGELILVKGTDEARVKKVQDGRVARQILSKYNNSSARHGCSAENGEGLAQQQEYFVKEEALKENGASITAVESATRTNAENLNALGTSGNLSLPEKCLDEPNTIVNGGEVIQKGNADIDKVMKGFRELDITSKEFPQQYKILYESYQALKGAEGSKEYKEDTSDNEDTSGNEDSLNL